MHGYGKDRCGDGCGADRSLLSEEDGRKRECLESKREGILLSLIMSLILIYMMAALNDNVRLGEFAASSWLLAIASGFILRHDFESIQVKKLCSDILK